MSIYTGGCQCGAVRFRCEIDLASAHVCHCRMCQKAFGSFYAPLVSARKGTVAWTKAEPKRFRSSSHAQRGFCAECGTPLTYEAREGVSIAIGAFDDPAAIAPRHQFGLEAKLPYVDELGELSGLATEDDPDMADVIATFKNHQHPDAPSPDEASPATLSEPDRP
ncbi:GFA family protein [Jiella mangrovi]|uniref:GFA family protein n=1 Tax=Jiella mangrovi TaxID=2821407 RepID=A0ABS4BJW4_9HYPH|nr:GFA family protein [Jiella mangrovi]MBP0617053.1 GFA family protein [Jiella mangrovi]